jgi:hypothetical protein
VPLVCYMAGAAIGARIARTPEPGDPVWPSAITRALAIEAVFFVAPAPRWRADRSIGNARMGAWCIRKADPVSRAWCGLCSGTAILAECSVRSSFAPQSTFMTAGLTRIFRVAAGSNRRQQ